MDIFYVKTSMTPHLKGLMCELGIIDGMPFTLAEDFHYDPDLNAFLRFIVTPAAPSPNTWKAYAEQLSLYLRFLESRGTHWKDAVEADIKAYWRLRRMGAGGATPVGASAWRTFVAAVAKFYEWALDGGLVAKLPFIVRELKSGWGGTPSRRTSIAEPVRTKELKYLDIGLLRNKLYPALQATENGMRDSLFGALLLSTGLRLSEANKLMLSQLPDPDDARFAGRKTCVMAIVGKGRKTRQIRIPKTILRDVDLYVRTERADAIDHWRIKHPRVKAMPERLFLSQAGGTISNRRWEKILEAASASCGLDVHPHMLRHSFAIYQLSAMVNRLLKTEREALAGKADKYSLLFKDPLRQLQQLMGNAHVTTTYIYLDYIQDTEDMVDGAVGDWTDSVFEGSYE